MITCRTAYAWLSHDASKVTTCLSDPVLTTFICKPLYMVGRKSCHLFVAITLETGQIWLINTVALADELHCKRSWNIILSAATFERKSANLRSAQQGHNDVPRVATGLGQRSFAGTGPKAWNSLPS